MARFGAFMRVCPTSDAAVDAETGAKPVPGVNVEASKGCPSAVGQLAPIQERFFFLILRSSSRISSTAPMVIAMSATLKAGKCEAPQ